MYELQLENKHGVRIAEKHGSHWMASNALCWCGEKLLVAAPIFGPDHKPGDPVLICHEFGHAAWRFSGLKIGRQDEGEGEGE